MQWLSDQLQAGLPEQKVFSPPARPVHAPKVAAGAGRVATQAMASASTLPCMRPREASVRWLMGLTLLGGLVWALLPAWLLFTVAFALSLPKSSVSRSIALLEEELGTRLLQRSSRKLSATEAGAAYYAQVAGALLPKMREIQSYVWRRHLAANADPQTGYQLRVNGADVVSGGTSAVAPLTKSS